jgi:DNA-binding beta-propeller fold protein YncE
MSGNNYSMCYVPTTNRIYVVTGWGTNRLRVINPSTNTIVNDLNLAAYANLNFGIVFCPTTNRVYMCGGNSTVIVINPNTVTIDTTIPVGTSTEFASYDPITDSICIGGGNVFTFIDPHTNTIIGTFGATDSQTSIFNPLTQRMHMMYAGGCLGVLQENRNIVELIASSGSSQFMCYCPTAERIFHAAYDGGCHVLALR